MELDFETFLKVREFDIKLSHEMAILQLYTEPSYVCHLYIQTGAPHELFC